MYKLSHVILILTVWLLAYSIAVVCVAGGWLGWITLAVVAQRLFKKGSLRSTTLGSGRFATEEELRRAGMIGGKGLVLGRTPGKKLLDRFKVVMSKLPSKTVCWQFMGYKEPVTLPPTTTHLSVFAPTGAGKNASLIIPWLLSVNESAVVVDVKGENAIVSARAREKMGQRVVILDPFGVITKSTKRNRRSDTFNPLDCIDRNSSRALDDCKALAKSLVKCPEGAERNQHFYDRAASRIAPVIGLAVYFTPPKGTRSLVDVADVLSNPKNLQEAAELMQKHPEIWERGLARMGGQIMSGGGEELASVTGTVNAAIDFLNSPDVAENMRTSSWDPRDLYRRKTTCYLVLPPEFLGSHSALMRCWLSSLIGVVIRGGLNKKNNVHFIIDEAGSVGPMDCVTDVLNVGRAYSLRLGLYYQDYAQLQRCWPNGASQGVLANTTSISFGVNDYTTAEMLSKRCGMETIVVESGGSNSGYSRQRNDIKMDGSTSHSSGNNSGWQEQKREVMTPDEIMAMSSRIALTFIPGMRPVATHLPRYYERGAPVRQSWLWRVRVAFLTLIRAALLLVFALFVAYWSTQFFQERFNYGGFFSGQAVQQDEGEPVERPF